MPRAYPGRSASTPVNVPKVRRDRRADHQDRGPMNVVGLLLAAGEGRRMGGPKAVVAGEDGTPWVVSAARVLGLGGCDEVHVAVGAAGATVRELLAGEDLMVVDVVDWSDGMGASLRAGLRAIERTEADVCMVHLVDLPDVGASVVSRVLSAASRHGLVRAVYGGRPGHPVAIGRDHWAPLLEGLEGDAGARAYLQDHGASAVECGDLATGHDVDGPPARRPGTAG